MISKYAHISHVFYLQQPEEDSVTEKWSTDSATEGIKQ